MRTVAVVALALLAGCVRVPSRAGEPRIDDVAVGSVRYRLQYWPEDAAAAAQVRRALVTATPKVLRWGALDAPVTITLHPSHDALEAAVHRPGYEWLRAWARFQTVDLQSPRTWRLFGARDRELTELLTHELTHCAMYQRAGNDLTWMYKEIPRWFSEGLASVSAGQDHRRGGIDKVWRFYEQGGPGSGDGVVERARAGRAFAGDPLVDPDPLYQDQADVVYGAAHHAVAFLIARYGEPKMQRVLALMGTGLRFPAAFKQAVGISDAEFASDFRRYVMWQGWR